MDLNYIATSYDVLEIDHSASLAEIKQSYRDMIAIWHPDKFNNNDRLREKATDKLKLLNEAYDVIRKFNDIHGPLSDYSSCNQESPTQSSLDSLFNYSFRVDTQDGRFSLLENVVADNLKHICWLRNLSQCDNKVNWNEASMLIDNLNRNRLYGLANWRLPTMHEYRILINYAKNTCPSKFMGLITVVKDSLINLGFTGVINDDYWSSNEDLNNVYAQGTKLGMKSIHSKYESKRVWPVAGDVVFVSAAEVIQSINFEIAYDNSPIQDSNQVFYFPKKYNHEIKFNLTFDLQEPWHEMLLDSRISIYENNTQKLIKAHDTRLMFSQDTTKTIFKIPVDIREISLGIHKITVDFDDTHHSSSIVVNLVETAAKIQCPSCQTNRIYSNINNNSIVVCPDCNWKMEINDKGTITKGMPVNIVCIGCNNNIILSYFNNVTKCSKCNRDYNYAGGKTKTTCRNCKGKGTVGVFTTKLCNICNGSKYESL